MAAYFPIVASQTTYAPLREEELGANRSTLEAEAKLRRINTNLPSSDLVSYIGLYDAGRFDEIPKDATVEGNFIFTHPRATGVGAGCLLLVILFLVVIFVPPSPS